MLKSAFITGVLLFVSIAIGVLGYHYIANIPWIDAILNASMILTGMGPVNPMQTIAGKLFASAYALFSGVAFLTMVGVLFAPAIHRILHRYHLELEPDEEEAKRKAINNRKITRGSHL